MKAKKKIGMILTILALLMMPMQAYAASASITFGSNWYTIEDKGEFPIGLYIRSDSAIKEYDVKVRYDNLRLKYVSGADLVGDGDGILTFHGEANQNAQVKFWLVFEPVGNGEAFVEVIDSTVTAIDGSSCTITEKGKVPVYIAKEVADDVAVQAEIPTETEKIEVATEKKSVTEEASEIIGSVIPTDPNEMDMAFYIKLGAIIVSILLLAVAIIILLSIAYWKWRRYRRNKRLQKKEHESIFEEVVPSLEDEVAEEKTKMEQVQPISEATEEKKTVVEEKEVVDMKQKERNEEPVISVKNVTMNFKVSTSSASGIKDFMIQKLKKQVSFRTLKALDNVSFDIYKGEVVGIIGTNGSGKSTMLKIVSGALRPSSGHVDVDRTKIQLLTLGTGFDHELTARENVYLNGAIIGYSKQFLDEHFDEIVEFAELDGFMDEKVKNFSSGMVSRLGFAIATVGDAAEILILDEVLSVGDEFFRKKSLKRVKEMIHGGSTVIMVSHSMATIKENCSKVVWIEKGKLRMVGTPDEVCPEYRKLGIDG